MDLQVGDNFGDVRSLRYESLLKVDELRACKDEMEQVGKSFLLF